jgi:hypothetical protein
MCKSPEATHRRNFLVTKEVEESGLHGAMQKVDFVFIASSHACASNNDK